MHVHIYIYTITFLCRTSITVLSCFEKNTYLQSKDQKPSVIYESLRICYTTYVFTFLIE